MMNVCLGYSHMLRSLHPTVVVASLFRYIVLFSIIKIPNCALHVEVVVILSHLCAPLKECFVGYGKLCDMTGAILSLLSFDDFPYVHHGAHGAVRMKH